MQVMYAEPMGSKTPNRSPQSGMPLNPSGPSQEGEEILHTPRHVPGTLLSRRRLNPLVLILTQHTTNRWHAAHCSIKLETKGPGYLEHRCVQGR